MNEAYTKRELDLHFADVKEALAEIKVQTTKHNGRLTKIEKILWTLGGAVGVLGAMNIPNLSTVAKVLAGI